MAGVGPGTAPGQDLHVLIHMEEAFEFVRYTNLIIHDTKALSAHSCSPDETRLLATWQSSHTAVNRHKVGA